MESIRSNTDHEARRVLIQHGDGQTKTKNLGKHGLVCDTESLMRVQLGEACRGSIFDI